MDSTRSRTSEGQISRYSISWQCSSHGRDLAELVKRGEVKEKRRVRVE